MSKLQKFSANRDGIDYVCADIHGHFSLLENALRQVDFDARKDRLFSLGDLIDRGEESSKALEYLQQPWFHAILGNHELMLMRAFETADPQVLTWWYYWGGDWAEALSREEMGAYYDAFKCLPVAIELSLRDQRRVALVHAQLPSPASWSEVCERLLRIPAEANPEAFELSEPDRHALAEMLWAKSQAYGSDEDKRSLEPVQGIDHVFHGHSIVYGEPLTITNRTFMDLGSYATGEIGLLDPVEYLQQIKSRGKTP